MAEATTAVGVDVGGTFTDVVLRGHDNQTARTKVPTTTPPDEGVFEGIETILDAAELASSAIDRVIHGTTIATNALLERSGANTALITTAGFRDVLEIGRQARPSLYDLDSTRPEPLAPRQWRYELPQRTLPPERDVEVESPTSPPESTIDTIANRIAAEPIESVAIGFLHADHDPEPERTVEAALDDRLDVPIIRSSAILPEFREYERIATTVASAYLTPPVTQYLERLETGCAERSLPPPTVMQSNGGVTPIAVARSIAVRLALSGPAAGVVGGRAVMDRFDEPDKGGAITLDMGGTSTDVSVVTDGRIERTTGTEIAGVPIALPMVDIETVGAGGGSIAWVDAGDALRVGPQSAGAQPGPACYGRGGTDPTVTDAAVALGLIPPETTFGQDLTLIPDRAREALAMIQDATEFETIEAVGAGILRVAVADMTQSIRAMTVERGRDPRTHTLVAFGGAGGLLAPYLANELDIDRIVFPRHGGVLSADGLLHADERHDHSRTLHCSLESGLLDRIETVCRDLGTAARERSSRPDTATLEYNLDLRYSGQAYELTIPVTLPLSIPSVRTAFEQAHEDRRGFSLDADISVVTARAEATVPTASTGNLPPQSGTYMGTRTVHLPIEGNTEVAIYDENPPDTGRFETPAIVQRPDTTLLAPPDWDATLHPTGALVLEASPQ